MIMRNILIFVLLMCFAAQLVVARPAVDAESTIRRGGSSGGKGGGGGGSRGGKGGSGSSSGGKGGSGSPAPKNSPSSNSGGRTAAGSGTRPYVGGKYYPGGATVPYTAGAKTAGGLSPVFVAPFALGALWPGLWLAGAYGYYYPHTIIYQGETRNATCLCTEYQTCGCDENTEDDYIKNLPSNITRTTTVNGTEYLLINGTLENGTTASGGSDSSATILRMSPAGMASLLVSVVFAFELLL
ncbi:hypothetical protein POJ06DRAFT_84647 [Lipomyces tetrasporus]|uniref:DUF7732 domain-containing protein n=1 Tax=Lipomyces tetrasporus TaxID=54092 RepID=A0AAD7VU87_9ASCO|nr:uncharacterized protein POJ06DRAFT_84647 [Lipomyces tetrasporus]KAJ8100945.1 hypothetical protein POJ06DRAFT_84647 [Lipomyces tetrasporus]